MCFWWIQNYVTYIVCFQVDIEETNSSTTYDCHKTNAKQCKAYNHIYAEQQIKSSVEWNRPN